MPAADRFVTIGASFSFGADFSVKCRSCGGALARHVDKVLPGDWNAIEGPSRASFAMALAASLRLLQSPLARDENERRILAIALDAIEEEFRHLDRIDAARSDEASDFCAGLLFQVFNHVAISLPQREPIAIVRPGKQ